MLLVFNVLTVAPYITISIVGPIIGLDRVPLQIYTAVFVFFLFSNVTNPIIQAYFRKDLFDTIKKYLLRAMQMLKGREMEEQQDVPTSGMADSSMGNVVVVVESARVEESECPDGVRVIEDG